MANRFERKESYEINEVLNYLPNPNYFPKGFKLKKIKKDYDGDMIKMGSDRYYTFKKSLCCAFCGIEGVIFHKERHLNKKGIPCSESFHFNLYAIDDNGNEILMTKDHIRAKARGGKDELSNYQSACSLCNEKKSATDNDKFKEQLRNKDVQLVLDENFTFINDELDSLLSEHVIIVNRTETENNKIENLTWV